MNPSQQTVNLYVTYVEKEGPFLKLWGQTDKSSSLQIEQFLLGASRQFDLGVGKIGLEALQPGALLCAKYKDNKYYRARIISNSFIQEGFLEVSFIDYGNRDVVPCGNIRSLQNFPTCLISVPPLAIGFIFAEAHSPGGAEWNDTVFENISKEIKYREVECHLLSQATNYFLVKIFIGGTDICGLLIQRGLMQPISLQAQQAVMLSMSMQKQQQTAIVAPQPNASVSPGINNYKACALEPGCLYPVYVSYVNDGPCHFSVQLKQSEDVLVKLMSDINTINLRLLEDIPIPGTVCLARCQEDGNICRAVVTNEVDNQFKVFYVDFGNYEIIPLDNLYQIPFKYVLPKVMATRLCLAGVDKSTVTIEMQCAFKKFVDNRLLHMKVLATPTRMAIPKCELWDPESKTSAVDVVNRAARHSYPEPISLTRGFSQPIKVSFVYSCNRFYVQLISKEGELAKLMADLQEICQTNDTMDPSIIKQGLPCCALFDVDQQWYRAEVVEVSGNNIRVRYIDYGNEELVECSQLREIDGEQLTVLRPQAVECCLNGYQNMEDDAERDGLLEEIILEGAFTMKVVEMLGKKALVELFDESNYNVSSLLLDKLAAAKSQISPMLVMQAGNKLEHRKNSFQAQQSQLSPKGDGGNYRQERGDRRPDRDRKDWNNKPDDRAERPWRGDRSESNKDRNNRNTNNNDQGSWRQNNKGFSPYKKPQENSWNNTESTVNNNDNWDNNSEPTNQANTRSANRWNKGDDDAGDNWNNSNQNETPSNDGRNRPDGDRAQPRNNFDNSRSGRFNNDREGGGGFGGKPRDGGGYKRRADESESNSYQQKGPRTSSRNDRERGGGYQKRYDKPQSPSFSTNDSWDVSAVTPAINAAAVTDSFATYDVLGTEAKVTISWFHNPGHFYCQVMEYQDQFKQMVQEIQEFYKSRKPEPVVSGAPVIGLFPEDSVLYRARVLEVIGTQYKVHYVDFGNVSLISKVWPIEKKFMSMPAQAIVCGLKGVSPPGESWPDADVYGKYFEKESFTCSFVDKDETKTFVYLSTDSESIVDSLIRDNLALASAPCGPNIEIPLLLGQQFRAVVKSVNSLSDIIVALECGMALGCAMHNLETATETFDDVVKGLVEQTVIVFVDNIVDDRLEITLYDTDGNKLVVLNPDEGAYDNVEPLCPILILSSSLTGFVSFADETSVHIQPAEYSEMVTYLLDQMFEHYEVLEEECALIPEEEQLLAVHSSDTNWYRGRVIGFDDVKVTVNYIDYGNSEDVEFKALRELTEKFKEFCVLCLQVTVAVEDTSVFVEKDVIANVYSKETINSWEGTIQLLESSTVDEPVTTGVTSLADTGVATSVSDEVGPECEAQTLTLNAQDGEGMVNDVGPEMEGSSEEYVPEVEKNGLIEVFMSHVDSPNEFYLQLLTSLNAIDELQAVLQAEISELPILETPTAGMYCAAPYSLDQQWYRAEILDADDDITTVRFVDFGNTDVINNKTTQIKTLPPHLLSLAVYATRCSLTIRPKDEDWGSNATDHLESLTLDNLRAEFIGQDEKMNYVELYYGGLKMSEVFVKEGYAIPAAPTTAENKLTGFVSHLNSPSEFWVQLESCIDELEWIAEQLSAAEGFPELEDLTPGTLCAALFPEDQMWYRARILSNTVAGIELLFIDYGNSCTSSSLRQLPEDLVITAPLALKCSLQKPDGIPNWIPEAAAKFTEISADGQTIFTIKKLSTGETTIVQLLLDGEDVTAKLQPVTEEGYVKNAQTLDKLKIETGGETYPEAVKLDTRPGIEWNEKSLEAFQEINKQGTTLFHIEFVNETTVRLYLDGKDIRTDLGGEKVSSLNVSKDDGDELCTTENDSDIVVDHLPLQKDVSKEDKESTAKEDEPLNGYVPQKIETVDPQPILNKDEEVSTDFKEQTEAQDGIEEETETQKIIEDVTEQVPSKTEEPNQQEIPEMFELNVDNDRVPNISAEEPQEQDEKSQENLQVSVEDEKETEQGLAVHKEDTEPQIIEGATDQVPSKTEEPNQKEEQGLADQKENAESQIIDDVSEQVPSKIEEPSQKQKQGLLADQKEDAESQIVKDALEQVLSKVEEPNQKEKQGLADQKEVAESQIIEDATDQVLSKTEEPNQKEESHQEVLEIVPNKTAENEIFNQERLVDSAEEFRKEEQSEEGEIQEHLQEEESQEALIDEGKITSETLCHPGDSAKTVVDDLALKSSRESSLEVDRKVPFKKSDSQSLPNSKENSRPSSRCSLRMSKRDERVLPTYFSRTDSPAEDDPNEPEEPEIVSILNNLVDNAATKCEKEKSKSRPHSLLSNEARSRPQSSSSGKISHDEKLVPAGVSRPHSPLSGTESNVKDGSGSRPQSSLSGKISFDDKIVPAVVSRPHSP